jgi:hypothetical protein
MQPLPDREVIRYLRLEEDEDTANLLLPTSVRYIGTHKMQSGASHFWSYPTAAGVAWVELSGNGSLGIAEDVPQSVRDATPPRTEHKMRKVAKQTVALPLSKRIPPAHAIWIPLTDLPACHYHEAWYETTSFDAAVKYYGAKVVRGSWAGPGCRCFYIQLTSGRYACIESRRDFPQTVIVSLEVDPRRSGKNSGGKVYVRDIEEVLAPMGGTFKMPAGNLYIGWSTDA